MTPSASAEPAELKSHTRSVHVDVYDAVGFWLVGGAPEGARTTDHVVAMADAVPVVAVIPHPLFPAGTTAGRVGEGAADPAGVGTAARLRAVTARSASTPW